MKRSSIEAVLADEGDKAGVADGRHVGSHGGDAHEGEDLLPLGAEGDDHATVGRELLDQGRRELGPPAATRIAWYGAYALQPRVPSPTRTETLVTPAARSAA